MTSTLPPLLREEIERCGPFAFVFFSSAFPSPSPSPPASLTSATLSPPWTPPPRLLSSVRSGTYRSAGVRRCALGGVSRSVERHQGTCVFRNSGRAPRRGQRAVSGADRIRRLRRRRRRRRRRGEGGDGAPIRQADIHADLRRRLRRPRHIVPGGDIGMRPACERLGGVPFRLRSRRGTGVELPLGPAPARRPRCRRGAAILRPEAPPRPRARGVGRALPRNRDGADRGRPGGGGRS